MLPINSYGRQCMSYLRDRCWDLFGHLTFPFPLTDRRADDLWHKFIHRINRQQYGKIYHKHVRKQAGSTNAEKKVRSVQWARATELQERGVVHFHFLIAGIKYADQQTITKATNAWRKLTGGNEHSINVLPYNPALGGIEYMCKKLDTFHRPLELGGDMPAVQLQS